MVDELVLADLQAALISIIIIIIILIIIMIQ